MQWEKMVKRQSSIISSGKLVSLDASLNKNLVMYLISTSPNASTHFSFLQCQPCVCTTYLDGQ